MTVQFGIFHGLCFMNCDYEHVLCCVVLCARCRHVVEVKRVFVYIKTPFEGCRSTASCSCPHQQTSFLSHHATMQQFDRHCLG